MRAYNFETDTDGLLIFEDGSGLYIPASDLLKELPTMAALREAVRAVQLETAKAVQLETAKVETEGA